MSKREEQLRLWNEAVPVEVDRRDPGTSSLIVRLSHRVFDRLVIEARRRKVGPGKLAAALIEEGLNKLIWRP